MEEAFPIRFTRGIRSYWRRRKYQRLGDGGGAKIRSTQQLGRGGGGRSTWGMRLRRMFRVRVKLMTPMRVLARIRDAYVKGMLGMARKASFLAPPNGPEGQWGKRVPRRLLPAQHKPTEFEQRLIFEIYKSIVASKELTGMLEASTAH